MDKDEKKHYSPLSDALFSWKITWQIGSLSHALYSLYKAD